METGCISYNICDDCKKYDDHPAEHTFVKFTTAEDAQAIIDTNDVSTFFIFVPDPCSNRVVPRTAGKANSSSVFVSTLRGLFLRLCGAILGSFLFLSIYQSKH